MHELIRGGAIISLCIGALLVAASARDEDTSLLGSTGRLLSSPTGLAAIFMFSCAVAGLTSYDSMLGLLLSSLIGFVAALILNAMNYRAARQARKRVAQRKNAPARTRTRAPVASTAVGATPPTAMPGAPRPVAATLSARKTAPAQGVPKDARR